MFFNVPASNLLFEIKTFKNNKIPKNIMENKLVKMCPICKSTNISFGDGTYYSGSAKDICLDCGFNRYTPSSFVFPKVQEKKAKKMRNDFLKCQNKNNPK